MGVKGLSRFFDLNPQLSTPHKLYDTRVVIDGNNLVHTLYFTYKIDCLYGGDYDRFASVVENYFSNLLSCKIEPHVVFDGGYEASGRKLKTVKLRSKQRLALAKSIARSGNCSRSILPLLATGVFINVITKMGIAHTQCEFEADEHIAALANLLFCPVISQDSDFYIFDLCGGFVRLDSMDDFVSCEDINGSSVTFLHCTIYMVKNFLSCFPGLDSTVLPLVGTLLGNDYVDVYIFSNFFANIRLPKMKSNKLKVSKQHIRMVGLLSWLQDRTTIEALDQVLARLKKNDREVVRQLVTRNMENYKCICWETESSLKTYSGKSLPLWLLRELRMAKQIALVINATVLRQVILQVQIETISVASSHHCSLMLRQIIYGILLFGDLDDKKTLFVDEYDRIDENKRWNKIVPVFNVPGYGQVPALIQIPDIDKVEKTRFLCIVLGCKDNSFEDFPENLQLLMACLVFARSNASPQMRNEFIYACLFCIILLTTLTHNPCDESPSNQNDSESQLVDRQLPLKSIMARVSPKEKKEVLQRMQKYFSTPQHNNAKKFQVDIVHSFSQLQSCVIYAKCLNSLLQYPFQNPEIESCFNGTFIYNLAVELKRRKFPRQYAMQLLAEGSLLNTIYQLVLNTLDNFPC